MKILKRSAIIVASIFFLFIAYSLIRLFISAKTAAARSQIFSNVKETSYAIYIYSTDYDDRLPHASSMPTLRAQVKSYSGENGDIHWKSDKDFLASTFNFNLSGVKISSIAPVNPDQPGHVMLYRIPIRNTDLPMVARIDTSTKSTTFAQLLKALPYQCDRKGVTLAPPDYLADQDPLREQSN